MLPEIDSIKGVHPGQVLDRELKKRMIGKSAFALQIGEYPAIITDITKMRRGFSASLSLKIEQALNANEGYFLVLQAYYDIEIAKLKILKNFPKPDLRLIRNSLFWDINIENLDFQKRKRFVIERVFERGNDSEIKEIIQFYGIEDCKFIIKSARTLLISAVYNAERFLKLNKKDLECYKKSIKKPLRKPYI